jgi:hypothetical protein
MLMPTEERHEKQQASMGSMDLQRRGQLQHVQHLDARLAGPDGQTKWGLGGSGPPPLCASV